MFATAVLLLVAAALATKEDLLVLTNENFYSEIENHGRVFVKFFAPWCGHCKRLAPTWEELAGTIDGVAVAEMDCTVDAHQEICGKYGVTGFPTLALIEKSGAAMKYEEERDLEKMRNWAIDMSGPASHPIAEDEKIRGRDISFILVGGDEKDVEQWSEAMAPYKGTFGIYHSTGKGYMGVGTTGKNIVISKVREDLKVVPFDVAKVAEIVQADSRLLVYELGPRNFSNMAADKEHLLWIDFVKNTHDETFDAEYAKMRDASMKCGELANFTYINAVDFEGFTKNFGEMKEVPFSIILQPDDYLYYKFPADGDICQFVADVKEGKIQAKDVRENNKKDEE